MSIVKSFLKFFLLAKTTNVEDENALPKDSSTELTPLDIDASVPGITIDSVDKLANKHIFVPEEEPVVSQNFVYHDTLEEETMPSSNEETGEYVNEVQTVTVEEKDAIETDSD